MTTVYYTALVFLGLNTAFQAVGAVANPDGQKRLGFALAAVTNSLCWWVVFDALVNRR